MATTFLSWGEDVAALLAGKEAELIDVVERAYVAHRDGEIASAFELPSFPR